MKHGKTLVAALLCVLLLACAAAAENTVTTTTDEEGHAVTIVTDAEGNQTIIAEVEPGADDITFDEDDLDLDDVDAPTDGSDTETAPDASATPEAQPEQGGSAVGWIIALAVAVCAVVGYLFFRRRKRKDA